MITAGLWLLIVCTAHPADRCRRDGGVALALVSEAQCRAALQMVERGVGVYVRCISPDGKWVVE